MHYGNKTTYSHALTLACALFIATAFPAAASAFLDEMLLKWVVVKCGLKDYAGAHDSCSKLLYEYPESKHTTQAAAMLPEIQATLRKERGAFPTPPAYFVQPFQTNSTPRPCSIELMSDRVLTNLESIASNMPAAYGKPTIQWQTQTHLIRTSFTAEYKRKGTDTGTGAPYEFTLIAYIGLQKDPKPYLVVSSHAWYSVVGWPALFGYDTEFFQAMTNYLHTAISSLSGKNR